MEVNAFQFLVSQKANQVQRGQITFPQVHKDAVMKPELKLLYSLQLCVTCWLLLPSLSGMPDKKYTTV